MAEGWAVVIGVIAAVATVTGAWVTARVRPPPRTAAEEWQQLYDDAVERANRNEQRIDALEDEVQAARAASLAAQAEIVRCEEQRDRQARKLDQLEAEIAFLRDVINKLHPNATAGDPAGGP